MRHFGQLLSFVILASALFGAPLAQGCDNHGSAGPGVGAGGGAASFAPVAAPRGERVDPRPSDARAALDEACLAVRRRDKVEQALATSKPGTANHEKLVAFLAQARRGVDESVARFARVSDGEIFQEEVCNGRVIASRP